MDCDEIRKKGWTQGSLVNADGAAKLASRLNLNPDGEYRIVLISHSCDIVNRSPDIVPYVEVCLAKLEKKNGNYLHGKNTRILQLPVLTDDGTAHLELNCNDIYRIERSVLADIDPSSTQRLDGQYVRTLRNWLAARYRRSALPDEFNERRRGVWNQIRKIAKNGASDIRGIYIALNPRDRDLARAEDYKVTLFGVMTQSDHDQATKRTGALDFLREMAGILNACDGIDVEDWELLADTAISLATLEYLQRLDFDDLSLREGENPPDL